MLQVAILPIRRLKRLTPYFARSYSPQRDSNGCGCLGVAQAHYKHWGRQGKSRKNALKPFKHVIIVPRRFRGCKQLQTIEPMFSTVCRGSILGRRILSSAEPFSTTLGWLESGEWALSNDAKIIKIGPILVFCDRNILTSQILTWVLGESLPESKIRGRPRWRDRTRRTGAQF